MSRKVKDMPRNQQKRVMAKIKPGPGQYTVKGKRKDYEIPRQPVKTEIKEPPVEKTSIAVKAQAIENEDAVGNTN